jgi:vacuolar-type H+-ATPase subunit I/STV1
MAPIKFENDLKDKLEQRKLQPSVHAWETLQERLDTNQNKKNNKGYWWFTIAASFVGILIISSIFFNKNKSEIIKPTIVDIEQQQIPKVIEKGVNPIEKETKVIVEKTKTEDDNPETKKRVTNKVPESKSELQQKQKALIKESTKVIVTQTETKIDVKENTAKPVEKLSFEDIKIQEVVAQVEALKKANNTVSDAEINSLLDQAQKEIALHKLYNETTKKINANALLEDVEADLEQSFRDRAFKAIKSGYKYVKTAVAERNN